MNAAGKRKLLMLLILRIQKAILTIKTGIDYRNFMIYVAGKIALKIHWNTQF
jgi:hypothetical protein